MWDYVMVVTHEHCIHITPAAAGFELVSSPDRFFMEKAVWGRD